MAEYHVECGLLSGEIYAGTVSADGSRWADRSTVTDEAVGAVRDHLLMLARIDGVDTYGYEWDTRDGGKVTLMVKIEEGNEDDK